MKPEPVFEDPWHAQIFALTVHLNEAGHFGWPEWAEAFGAGLSQRGLEQELNGGADYFDVWLETLETFLLARGIAAPDDLASLKEAWTDAYLSTPHGQPVQLQD